MPSYPYPLTITNPGAETGNTTGWTNSVGTLLALTSGGGGTTPRTGTYLFRAGSSASTLAYQDIAVPGDAYTDVDAGSLYALFRAWHAGFSDADRGQLRLEFYNGSMVQLGSTATGPDTTCGIGFWSQNFCIAAVPTATRTIRILLAGTRTNGTNLDVYWDDLTLQLQTDSGLEQESLSEDFSGLTTGATYNSPTNPPNFVRAWGESGDYEVVADVDAVGGKFLRRKNGASEYAVLIWQAPTPTMYVAEVYARMKVHVTISGITCGLALRVCNGTATGSEQNGYLVLLSNGGTEISMVKVEGNGAYTETAVLPEAIVAGDYFEILVSLNGPNIDAKLWKSGSAEPGSWQVDFVDSKHLIGAIGFAREQFTNQDFDYISVGTNGASAPRPAPSNTAPSVTIDQGASGSVEMGDTLALSATVLDAEDDPVPDPVWTSDDEGVATVHPTTGLVTPVSVGECNITATVTDSGSLTDSASFALSVEAAPGAPAAPTLSLVDTGPNAFLVELSAFSDPNPGNTAVATRVQMQPAGGSWTAAEILFDSGWDTDMPTEVLAAGASPGEFYDIRGAWQSNVAPTDGAWGYLLAQPTTDPALTTLPAPQIILPSGGESYDDAVEVRWLPPVGAPGEFVSYRGRYTTNGGLSYQTLFDAQTFALDVGGYHSYAWDTSALPTLPSVRVEIEGTFTGLVSPWGASNTFSIARVLGDPDTIRVTRLQRLEVWTDVEANGGRRLAFVPDVIAARARRELQGPEKLVIRARLAPTLRETTCPEARYSPLVLADNPLAWYRFDETGYFDPYEDSSGSGYDIPNNGNWNANNTSLHVSGCNDSLYVTGPFTHAHRSAAFIADRSSIAVEALVRYNRTSSVRTRVVMEGVFTSWFNDWRNERGLWNLGFVGNTPHFEVRIGDQYYTAASPDPVALDRIHHYHGYYDGADVVLMVDGVEVARTETPGGDIDSAPVDGENWRLELASAQTYIYKRFVGSIDELAIFPAHTTDQAVADRAAIALAEQPSVTAWGEVRTKRVLRTVYDPVPGGDETYEEWRIQRASDERQEDGGLVGVIEADGIAADLADTRIVKALADGQKLLDFDLLSLTPAQHLAEVLTHAKAYFLLGDVEGDAVGHDLSFDWDSVQSAIRALEEMAELELDVRRAGLFYGVHLVEEIGADAPTAYLRFARQNRSLRRTEDGFPLATRVYPKGQEQDSFASTMGEAAWPLVDVDGSEITLPEDVILFQGQLDGTYVEKVGETTGYRVLSSGPDQVLTLEGAPAGYTSGDEVHIRADANGAQLVHLDNPATRGLYGLYEVVEEATDIPPVDNLVPNAFLSETDVGGFVGWTRYGDPGDATITENTDAQYTRYGGKSAKVTAQPGFGIETDPIPVVPTQARPFFTGQVALFMPGDSIQTVGAVQLQLVAETAGGGEVIYPDPAGPDDEQADSTERGVWIERLGIAAPANFFTDGVVSVKLRLIAKDVATLFYLDAAQITQTAAGSEIFYDGRASNDLWDRAQRRLARDSFPALTYEVRPVDLFRMDAGAYPADELVKGGTALVADLELGINASTRIVDLEQDLLTEGETQVTLSTRPNDLTSRLLGKKNRRRHLAIGGVGGTAGGGDTGPVIQTFAATRHNSAHTIGGGAPFHHHLSWTHNQVIQDDGVGQYTLRATEKVVRVDDGSTVIAEHEVFTGKDPLLSEGGGVGAVLSGDEAVDGEVSPASASDPGAVNVRYQYALELYDGGVATGQIRTTEIVGYYHVAASLLNVVLDESYDDPGDGFDPDEQLYVRMTWDPSPFLEANPSGYSIVIHRRITVTPYSGSGVPEYTVEDDLTFAGDATEYMLVYIPAVTGPAGACRYYAEMVGDLRIDLYEGLTRLSSTSRSFGTVFIDFADNPSCDSPTL